MKRFPAAYVSLSLVLFLLAPASVLHAQTTNQLAAVRDGNTPPAVAPAPRATVRRIGAPRAGTTADGSRVTLAADAALDDYAAYRDGEQFFVLIPRAEVTGATNDLNGRGFTAAHVERRAGDLLLAFQLAPGAQAHVTQKFNRLEIEFTARTADSVAPEAVPSASVSTINAQGDQDVLRQLLRRIEDLEAQVRELKAAGATGAAPHTAAHTQPAEVIPAEQEAASEQERAQAILDEHGHDALQGPRLQIQGFADVNWRASNEKGTTNAFALGQLDLFLTSRLSEKFTVLGELVLDARRDNSFEFEIHRLLLRYAPNDYFNISAGRYHTSIGYYNTAYHHGSWFQTAANRPYLFAFEGAGGPLPLHNSGLAATGLIPSGSLGLHYIAELGNGRSARRPATNAVQTSFDENNGKAFNLGLYARPDAVPGLQAGFSYYRDRLTPEAAPNVKQSIMAAHLIYRSPRYEWLSEAIFFRHQPTTGTTRVFNTPGFYTQFARRFGKAQPYFRYQYVNAPDDDPVLTSTRRRNGPSVGLRYDVTEYAAVKAQYDRTARRRQQPLDEVIMQLAFTF